MLFALVLGACTACVQFGSGEPGPSEVVSQSVQAALPDASAVLVKTSQSGTSSGWAVEIDYPLALTSAVLADALSAVVEADTGADHVTLYFFERGTDDSLAIRTAADELGFPWTRVGSGGSWLVGQID